MTPQHMVEHLEYTYKIASGEIQDFEIATPEKFWKKSTKPFTIIENAKRIRFSVIKKSKIRKQNIPIWKQQKEIAGSTGELFEIFQGKSQMQK